MDDEIVRYAIKMKIALKCREIINTKWYQFLKRKKLYKEASQLAKIYNIKFP